MAYNNSPENSTYKTVNLEFTETMWPRSGVYTSRRDSEMLNVYYDRNSNENQTRSMVVVKRPGLSDTTVDLQKANPYTELVNGYYHDLSGSYIYWAVGNDVYSRNSVGTITQIATMTNTNTGYVRSVGFCMFLTSAGTRYLCFSNGQELWYHTVGSGSSTEVTDVDLPVPHNPTPVFLDGYLFLIKADTGDIYNSDLDTPSSWTAGNYVTAEINADNLLALAKIKNYLAAFGTEGIEFFYDAANTSGSPLGRNESYYQPVTLISSIEPIGDTLYFIGRHKQGLPRAFALDGNNLQEISNDWVNRYLEKYSPSRGIDTGFADIHFFLINTNGHNFLLLNLFEIGIILVYDIKSKFWYKWTFGVEGAESNRIEAVWSSVVYNDSASSYGGGVPWIVLSGKQYISSLSPTTYQDFSTNFTCSYTTQDYNGDTFNWKSCPRVGLLCDQYTDSGTSNVSISWSDNDGGTYSTARSINVFSQNPYITQTGRFRSRNWRISYSDNYPFRMWGVSMDLNIGSV